MVELNGGYALAYAGDVRRFAQSETGRIWIELAV